MKQLWTGEEVNYEGKFWSVREAKMGFTPIQQPHPPIWIACQSDGAVRRSARIADACYIAPQVGFNDLGEIVGAYKQELGGAKGRIAISRGVAYGRDRAAAGAEAQAAAESSYRMYSTWNMQEDTMVKITSVVSWLLQLLKDDALVVRLEKAW